jgi:acetyltransferase-like isoleucine patch superfamily enzyme
MMKMKFLLKIVGSLLSMIFPVSLSGLLNKIHNQIYTGYRMKRFRQFGKQSVLFRPIMLQGEKYISIGNKCRIYQRCILTAWDKYENQPYMPEIIIGDNTAIGEDCHITAINCIRIGNNVLLGKKITITDNSHGTTDFESLKIPPSQRKLYSKGPVIIGDRVWIGDKATILPNVNIGEGAVIGANAVVAKDVPAGSVVVTSTSVTMKSTKITHGTGNL